MNTQSNDRDDNHTYNHHDNHHRLTGSAAKPSSGRQRRLAVLGVTAGLLGGGTIGLLAAAPSFSSAASTTSAISAAVAEPTDAAPSTAADTTAGTDDTTDPADRPDPSVKLRESLQTLVDDGTISADQADAVTTHLASLRSEMEGPMGGGMGRHGGERRADGGPHPQVLAELLGLEVAEIRTAFEAGSTVAELAEANGVDVQTVIAGLVHAGNLRIDEAVADGRLTEEQAASKRAELLARISEAVNTVRPAGRRAG